MEGGRGIDTVLSVSKKPFLKNDHQTVKIFMSCYQDLLALLSLLLVIAYLSLDLSSELLLPLSVVIIAVAIVSLVLFSTISTATIIT